MGSRWRLSCRLAVVASLAGGATASATASADPGEPSSARAARDAMETYFAGEKRGGLVLVGMGAVGAGAGALLLTRDSDLARGVGYPLLAVGAVHAAAGIFVYVSSAKRVDRFGRAIDADAAAFAAREHERMGGVRTQFFALKIVEAALVAGGAGAAIYGIAADEELIAGIGIGVVIEAAATLVFDIVADRRAVRYRDRLAPLRVTAAPGGAALELGLRF